MDFAVESFAAIKEEIEPLVMAHWEDARMFDDVKPDVNWDQYINLEESNILLTITARVDGALVGYQNFAVVNHHHYKSFISAQQLSIFVHPDHRKGLAGVTFIKYAEKILKAMKVDGIFLHTKQKRDLSRLFERLGYEITDIVMTKRL